MSPDLFPKYLKDTSLLYRISYEELKTLVVQYPYCQNLRYLLLVKSKMDGNVEQERNMKMASAYSQDRTKLYLLLKDDLKEAKKDFEFLDLNHAVTDDNHPELELPILDFSNGIEVEKSKKSKRLSEELDLFLDTNLGDDTKSHSIEDEEKHPIAQEEYHVENTSEDLLSLFKDDEDEELEDDFLAKEALVGLATVTAIQEAEEEIIEDSWEFPLVPPSIDLAFIADSEIQESPEAVVLPLIPPITEWSFEVVQETPIVDIPQALVFPLVPPQIDLSFTFVNNKEIEIPAETPISLPLVPPSVDLTFVQNIPSEEVEDIRFELPLVPPLHGITFDAKEIEILTTSAPNNSIIIEEIEEVTDSENDVIDRSIEAALQRLANAQKIEAEKANLAKEEMILESPESEVVETAEEDPTFVDEIDQSIQAALQRLADEQQIEAEQEEAEEEARIAAIIKEEMILEGIIVEEEKEEGIIEPVPVDDTSQSQHQGPMPKASFNSWLKQMAAPTPSFEKKEDISNTAKKKKKKKKKRSNVENEGSRLIKAIKARQEQQQKEETKMMLVRKRKVIALAERSLRENEEIVSETLAKILVIQGKKDKAAHMYRQLMLKFPKKSSFFAAEIEKILK